MKQILLKSTVIFLVIFLFSCGSKEKEGYTTYTNEQHGFTISYPEEWTFREGFAKNASFETGSIVVFQAPGEGKKDMFRENIHIFTEPLPDSVKNLESYFNYSKSYLPTQLEEFKILESRKTLVDDVPSYMIIFEYVNRLQRVNSLGYLFYRDAHGLVITSTARPEDFMRFRRTFEDIATSIEFE